MPRSRLHRQRGQALLIVLAFVAAFLLLITAALWLASGAFLGLANIKTDTRDTYALDAGLAYAIETNDSAAKGSGCNNTNGNFNLNYGASSINVQVAISAIPGCKTNKPSYTILVTAPSVTKRQLTAQISSSNAGKKASWVVNWEAFQ